MVFPFRCDQGAFYPSNVIFCPNRFIMMTAGLNVLCMQCPETPPDTLLICCEAEMLLYSFVESFGTCGNKLGKSYLPRFAMALTSTYIVCYLTSLMEVIRRHPHYAPRDEETTTRQRMDTRRCYFPNYHMEDYEPSPSHWPLSHIRSSVSSQDDSLGLETFAMGWVGNQHIPIPYQERTIRNLTGRSLQESFAGLKRKRSPSCSGSPPPSREPDAREKPDPLYLLKKECPSSDEPRPSASMSRLCDQDLGTDATRDIKEMKQAPTQLRKQCDMMCADVQQHNSQQLARSCTNETSTMAIENISSSPSSLLIQREQTPQSSPMHQQLNQVLASTHKSDVSQPSSEIHAQSTEPPLPLEQSEDDNDAMDDEESNRPTRVKKPKPKSNQQASHMCKLCDITFTRHFDLLRHNQKHQVTEEDMAPRTCTNCKRILSRVDATKRHVNTLPESCNYLRRKEGLRSLPAMPAEHYDACRELYYKLAQERKKPKGRKKANPAASLS